MPKIYAPNTEYNGTSAGVAFKDGVAETDNESAISYFRRKGFRFEESEPKPKTLPEMTIKELQAYASENGIDLAEAKKKDEILEKISAFEKALADASGQPNN